MSPSTKLSNLILPKSTSLPAEQSTTHPWSIGADVFRSGCTTLEIQYRHDQQGLNTVSPNLRVANGQTVGLRMNDGTQIGVSPTTFPGELQDQVDPTKDDHLIVVVPVAVNVIHVACVVDTS